MAYPSIEDYKFQEKIADKFDSLKISGKKPTFNELCFPKEYTHQLPQRFVSKFINPKTKYKGLLVFHKIGAGKTCASILIGEEWIEHRKVIFIVPASLVGNLYKEFRTQCTGNKYVRKVERKLLEKLNPSSIEYKDLIKKINKRIDKYYDIYSFHKYVHLVEQNKINLKNSLIIVDEVQNIVSERGSFYSTILKSFQESPASTRIVIMSATPIFDKPVELALTLNLLKPTNVLPIGGDFNSSFLKTVKNKYDIKNKELLRELIRGYISFYPGAPAHAFPKKTIKLVKCEMSRFQYECYKTVEEQEGKPDFKDILKLSNDFFIGSRMMSNICYPNKKVNEKGLNSLEGKKLCFDKIGKFSIKFLKIIQKAKSIKGPSIVYSNFRGFGGIDAFIKVLEYNGYINVLNPESTQNKYNKKRFGLWTGKEKMPDKETAKNIYNSKSNADGSLLKFMIISPSGKEGLSLLRTKSIHIMEPYWNPSRIAQVIGRGIRFCSHKDLPLEERIVQVFMYIATAPVNYKTIDEHIYKMAVNKNNLINKFYQVMEESAIDRKLNIKAKKFI